MALLAPLIAPHDPYAQDLSRRMIPPIWYEKGNWSHLLGTDNLGRDYLSRVLYGAQISLLIGVAVMVISGLIGTALGLAAGFFGGRVDMIVTFFITVRLALPVILVALAVVATVGGSLWVVILVLGLLKWDRFAVVMRAATQQVRVARLCGGGGGRRRIDPARHSRRSAAERAAATDRGGDASRPPARSCSKPRCPSSDSACSRRCRPGG